jgi:hypothetical protein
MMEGVKMSLTEKSPMTRHIEKGFKRSCEIIGHDNPVLRLQIKPMGAVQDGHVQGKPFSFEARFEVHDGRIKTRSNQSMDMLIDGLYAT